MILSFGAQVRAAQNVASSEDRYGIKYRISFVTDHGSLRLSTIVEFAMLPVLSVTNPKPLTRLSRPALVPSRISNGVFLRFHSHNHNCYSFWCSEFNFFRDSDGNCVLVPGTTPLRNDESCKAGDEYWYERTAYRKIPYSSCEDGYRPDRGTAHMCPGFKSKGILFWSFMLLLPFGFTALVAYYYYRRSGLARG